jgi:hypothetical protein
MKTKLWAERIYKGSLVLVMIKKLKNYQNIQFKSLFKSKGKK